MRISLGPDVLQDFDTASRREWLVTNGLGGYASSSLSGANTRHYHGLLVAAVDPPCVRRVFLSQLEISLTIGGETYELGSNRYPGTIHPQGHRFLQLYDPWPAPTFVYSPTPDLAIAKRVWMAHEANTTYLEVRLLQAAGPVSVRFSPLICDKGYHEEMRASDTFPRSLQVRPGAISAGLLDGRTLHLRVAGADVETAGYWHYRLQHDRERERGWEYEEDLYCPGHFVVQLKEGEAATLVATIEQEAEEPGAVRQANAARLLRLTRAAGAAPDTPQELLALAADAFVVEGPGLSDRRAANARPPRSTIIAGYHWFTDWGRDTMISLPGLCLATGRHEVARDILLSYAQHVSEGLVPNRFPDRGEEPEYNTIDASLWFIQAGAEYLRAMPSDVSLLEELWPAWTQIVKWHLAGTRYGIRIDPADGLLAGGEEGVQLTWMDAKAGDWVVTPRMGKPVEVNALWYNALRAMESLAVLAGDKPGTYAALARKAEKSFRAKFVRPDGLGLYDVIAPEGPDPSIRPNQIFAVSLPHSALTPDQQRSVVEIVERELLTPVGLRSLSRNDPRYQGRYQGGPIERDGAYHQGTVWTWLLGPFVEAHLRVYQDAAAARLLLEGLMRHLTDCGVGYLCEIYDGDPPHRPNGCIAQAWSVGEVLRVLRLLSGGARHC